MIMKAQLRLATVLLLGATFSILSSCDRVAEESVLKGEASTQSSESEELVILNWDDYLAPEVIAAFEEETGVRIRLETFESLGELQGKLQSEPDAYDLVVVDDVTLNELKEVQLLGEINHGMVPNLSNIDDKYLDLAFDPGNRYSVPYLWGTTLVAYRADKIEDPDQSWNLLWDPALEGKVAMMDEKEDLYAASLLSLGFRLNSEDPAELEAAFERLVEQRELVKPLYRTLGDVEDLLISGKVWVACLYSGDAAMLAEEDDRIDYFIPDEGAPKWMDNLAITKEARHPEEAHQFINFISRGDIAAQNAGYLWTATPNLAAESHMDEELRQDETVYPLAEVRAKCDFHAQPSPDRLAIINKGMKNLFDGARQEMAETQDAGSE